MLGVVAQGEPVQLLEHILPNLAQDMLTGPGHAEKRHPGHERTKDKQSNDDDDQPGQTCNAVRVHPRGRIGDTISSTGIELINNLSGSGQSIRII